MRVPVEILVALCLVVGLLPQLSVGPLLQAASAATLGGAPPPYTLAIWHGFNLPFVMSLVALAGGLIWYRFRHFLYGLDERYAPDITSPVAFERVFNATAAGARRDERRPPVQGEGGLEVGEQAYRREPMLRKHVVAVFDA
jgi:multicomponent K+:H+ antiporter subunit A